MATVPLNDLTLLIVDSEHKTAPKDREGLHPLIRTTDLGVARADFRGAQRVNGEIHALWTKRAVPTEGDLILAREAPVGGICRVPAGIHPVLGQRTVLIRPDPARADGRFLLYRLAAPDMQARLVEMSTGATVPHLNMADIRQLDVPDVPSLATQCRLGTVLSAFDELIEINQRRIEVLEDLARSLYREWFVRFRFPGHEEVTCIDTEMGRIPDDGWTIRPASEVFEINPRVSTVQESFWKVAMADVNERFSYAHPSGRVNRASGSRFELDDVLLARITPCLENGKTALVRFLRPGEVAVGSTEFLVLRGRGVGPAFVYCAARSDQLREHAIKSMSGATGRQRVSADCFHSLNCVEPPTRVAEMFEAAVYPMLREVFELSVQSRALAATRDLLLPRLVTGRLDISDIDLGELLPAELAA